MKHISGTTVRKVAIADSVYFMTEADPLDQKKKMLGETSILLTVFTVDTKTDVCCCGKFLVPPPLCTRRATLHLSFQPSSHSPPFISIPPSLPFCLCYVCGGDLSVIYSLAAVCVFMECHSLCSASQLLILVRETKRTREALKFNDVAGI